MKTEKKKGKGMFLLVCISAFIVSFAIGAISKIALKPLWAKQYSVQMTDEIGKVYKDIAYGDSEANRFDMYIPADRDKKSYGLAVYLHAGGFTSGDKSDDAAMLSWLCSKGYVAAGINYTLRTEGNDKSVYSQSMEIKEAVPEVIEKAESLGYHIDKLTIAGGSAGHALAMIYAYRDAGESPVPVVLTFGGVGPSCFYTEDWNNYGLDLDTEDSYQAAAALFGVMLGEELTVDEIKSGAYIGKMKPISPADWITPDSAPTVVAYGKYDRVQPFKASSRLKAALEENGVDYKYFEFSHSGHGLQNDNAIQRQWMEAIEEYLDKYMPVN